MKLYQSNHSPNSRRVRIFLAEKGLQVPYSDIDITKGASHTPAYLHINPMGEVPVLELDDGCHIAESVAICRYFEALHPQPSLFGITPAEIATTEMWQRRVELKWFGPLVHYWMHTSPIYAHRLKQIPDWAEQNRVALSDFLAWLDGDLSGRDYIAGNTFTIADILALAAFDHGNHVAGFHASPELKHLAHWHATVSSRPSARA